MGEPCARVYDLTVHEHYEFYVHGVLVSNCIDALRYACEAVRKATKPADKPKPAPDYYPGSNAWMA